MRNFPIWIKTGFAEDLPNSKAEMPKFNFAFWVILFAKPNPDTLKIDY